MSSPVPLIAEALRQVTENDLRDLVGDSALRRGRSYATQSRVNALQVTGPTTVSAAVRGQGRVYRTEAEIAPDGEVLGGDCSCPVGGDCKHVVALVITARQTFGLAGAASGGRSRPTGRTLAPALAQPPAWERLLGGVLAAPSAASQFTPLGLLIDLQAPRGGPYAADPHRTHPRPVLRPVIPGKTGWVRTGVSWSGLDHYGYGQVRLDPRQKDALHRLLNSGAGHYRYYSQPDWLNLETLDDGWLPALRHCRRVGIELLTDQRHSGRVVLADEPATITFDLTGTPDGGVRITPQVTLPDELDAHTDTSMWVTVGAPPTGLWSRDGADLLLAAFETALDVETHRALQHGPVDVPPADVARFLAEAVPLLAKRFRVESPDASVEIPEVAPPRLTLLVTHLPGLRLGLDWSFCYAVGETAVTIPIDSADHLALRDAAAEAALLTDVAARHLPRSVVPASLLAGGSPGGPPGGAPSGAARPAARPTLAGFDVVTFVDQLLPGLEQDPSIDVTVDGEPITYTEAPEPPSVRLSVTESTDAHDWFDLGVEVTVGAEQVPISDLVTAFTLGQQQVILPTGTWFRVDRPELAELQRLVEEARALQDDPRGPLRLSPYHADLWAELEALGVVEEQSERWARLVKGLTASSSEPVAAPSGLQASLRPYQHEGFEWLTFLRRHGLGGILADDMGLGKTLQALAMILLERSDPAAGPQPTASVSDGAAPAPGAGPDAPGRAPWLVVAPASVLAVWAGEVARFAPQLRVVVLPSTTTRRGTGVAEAVSEADLVVTSYAVFRLDDEEFRDVQWAGLILDEAQAVKNHQAVTYQCVRRLAAPVRFAITGTPMENNLMELWSLLSIVAPGLFPHPKAFTEHFRRPIESGSAPELLATLRRRIRPVMLRRTKQSVALDLPPKQEQLVRVELPPRHRRIYDRGLARQRQRVLGLLEDAGRNRIAIFRALTLLRQLSLHPGLVDDEHLGMSCAKIDTLLEMLEPVLAEGHRALVFSQFTSFLALVRQRLDERGLSYSYLDGRTRKRQQVVEEFRTGQNPVFLISLKAGGVGLTLTEADYVFLLDPWWNPAVEAQAVDRTHRIGQDKPVNVYRLVSGDTIEDKVVALQERKRELFASVVDEGALASGVLSAEDIRGLL